MIFPALIVLDNVDVFLEAITGGPAFCKLEVVSPARLGSMMRSSTMSFAILAAFRDADWSNATTFDAMFTMGIAGRIQSCAEAGAGPEFGGGGSAAAAELDTQRARSGPAPTLSPRVGVDPSASPAAGSGLCVERSAATGRTPVNTRATASATGRRKLIQTEIARSTVFHQDRPPPACSSTRTRALPAPAQPTILRERPVLPY